MTGRLQALRDRPIAEQERRTALAATSIALAAAALAFAHTRPATHPTEAGAAVRVSATADLPAAAIAPVSAPAGSEALAVSRAFLAGYLAYAYADAPAGRIADAAGALAASLEAHPPRVPPAMRAERPRVLGLHADPASAGEARVSAAVNTGGLVDYTLALTLTAHGGRLLVTQVGQG